MWKRKTPGDRPDQILGPPPEAYSWYNNVSGFLDNLRIVPRLLMLFYMYLVWRVSDWFIMLPDPTANQAAFATGIISAGALWFGIYVGTGSGKTKN